MKPRRAVGLALLCVVILLLAYPRPTAAGRFLTLHDPFDDINVLSAIGEDPGVRGLVDRAEALKVKFAALRQEHVLALFGKPVPKPDGYAMFCSEPRILGLSGIRYGDARSNKDHADFHAIGDQVGVEVYYAIDGVTPAHFQFYRKVDKDFQKLTNRKHLKERLAWDVDGFRLIERHYETRRRLVFQWEIDPDRAKKLNQDLYVPDFDKKLAAWSKWGKEKGYESTRRPAARNATPTWEWHDEAGRLVARVSHDRGFTGGDGKPCYFVLFRPDGTRRFEAGGWPSQGHLRWQRADATNIRHETGSVIDGMWRPSWWQWWNEKGECVRWESDTNGDGIPDVFGDAAPPDRKAGKCLGVESSWAVRAELIPKACRVPDQGNFYVPIRNIPPME